MEEDMEAKWVEMERKAAVDSASDWINNVVATFERAVRETNSYKSRFMDSVAEVGAGKDSATKPDEVISWLVNSTACIASNLRLDMACKHAAALSEAYRKVKALETAAKEAEVAERTASARWMLTAARTVLPSIKSARAVAAAGLRPTIVCVGTFEMCYERAGRLTGRYNASKEHVLNSAGRLPVVVTDDWTYHVVEIAAMDDARV